jgi:putative ABC transport system substrate-binding protein
VSNRRKLLVALGASALFAPIVSLAQQKGKVWRIGFLGIGTAADYASRMEALRAGLRELGYVEGKNVAIEYRWAEGKSERLPDLAAELARLDLDVLVTSGTPGVRAAKQATKTIPIVMAASGDAVATGLVASLARPGGNITGSTFFSPELSSKRVELLKEAVPHITKLTYLMNLGNPVAGANLKAMEITSKILRIGLQQSEVRGPNEFVSAFAAMTKQHVDALAISQDSMINANVGVIANLAARQRLPSIGPVEFAAAGGLIGYGNDIFATYRRASYFVDKIFKGARPADIPIEQPTKFELVVNMKTAKALGITIPQSILVRADRVIE